MTREALAVLGRAARHPRGRRALVVAVAAVLAYAAAVAAGLWLHRVWLVATVPAALVALTAAAVAVAHGQPD